MAGSTVVVYACFRGCVRHALDMFFLSDSVDGTAAGDAAAAVQGRRHEAVVVLVQAPGVADPRQQWRSTLVCKRVVLQNLPFNDCTSKFWSVGKER